jgi:endonuclease III
MSGDGKRAGDGADGRRRAEVVRALLDTHGQTYAEQAGIKLRDTPAPLYQLLVLSLLLSARIRADTAVAAGRALFDAGMRDAKRMAEASWQQRVDALGVGGYRRYDERTSTQLGQGAELLLERYGGDVRRMREAAGRRPEALHERLQEIPGIGPTGASIFLREVQAVWPEVAPYIDGKALDGARRLGLPEDPGELARLARKDELAPLTAGLVRAALDKGVVEDVREHADGG